METSNCIYCFRANYQLSTKFDRSQLPDWLSVKENWQGYRITTVPWVAEVAKALDLLNVEDTPEAWITYLQSLGLEEVTHISCEDLYEDTLYH